MKTALLVALTALFTFMVVWALSAIAMKVTGVPDGFPPFTALPLLSGVAGGFVGASAVYAIVKILAVHPDRVFFYIALAFLALSFALPLRLNFTSSRRFMGVTPAAQMTLALFHTLIAASCVTALTRIGVDVR